MQSLVVIDKLFSLVILCCLLVVYIDTLPIIHIHVKIPTIKPQTNNIFVILLDIL